MKLKWPVAVAALALVFAPGHVALGANAAGLDDATRMGSEMMNPGSGMPCLARSNCGRFKVLIYGNSIARHRPLPSIGWTNDWGMAASAPEKDFAHLVVAGLEAKLGMEADFRIRGVAAIERNFTTNIASIAEISDDIAWSPDYVVIAIGENSPRIDDSNASDFQKMLADLARPFAKRGAKIVMRAPFWMNRIKAACTEKEPPR